MFEHFPRLLETYLVKIIVTGVTAAAAYGVVVKAADDVVAKVYEVIAEIVENASNMQEIPAVNDVIALGMIPKQDS
jgi:transposase-like protein